MITFIQQMYVKRFKSDHRDLYNVKEDFWFN